MVAQILGVALAGALALPLLLTYAALVLAWLACALVSGTYLVAALLVALTYLYDGDVGSLWGAGRSLAISSAVFSLVVVGAFLNGTAWDRVSRPKDDRFNG